METKEIKKLAYRAAAHDNISVETDIQNMNVQERLYYLEMLYYYRLFDAGRIPLTQATKIEQKINIEHSRLDNDLWLSQEEYKRAVKMAMKINIERTKLCKQLLSGDRDFIHTLLHLLDIYTGEGIYNQMYQIMRVPLTDQELDAMVTKCPEHYFRKFSRDDAREILFRVVQQLNDVEVPEADYMPSCKPKRAVQRSAKFIPPKLEEITNYCKERNKGVNPEQFQDFYESNGWMVGKNKMKDWKAAIRTWEKRVPPKKPEQKPTYDIDEYEQSSAFGNFENFESKNKGSGSI